MKVIGITGTSGAGKTTLTQILNKRKNVEIIDADKISKQMCTPGNKYLEAIKNTFGNEYFFKDGNLDRKKMAKTIYNDKIALEKLNNLSFNYVVKKILEEIKRLKNEKIEFIVLDAALLFEGGLEKYCDIVISLIADKDLKIKRICDRDNIDVDLAEDRLNIQQNDAYYIERSDFIIYNKKNCDLEKEIEKILEQIRRE